MGGEDRSRLAYFDAAGRLAPEPRVEFTGFRREGERNVISLYSVTTERLKVEGTRDFQAWNIIGEFDITPGEQEVEVETSEPSRAFRLSK